MAEMILSDKKLIDNHNSMQTNNYCGNGNLLNQLHLELDGLEKSIIKYENLLNANE